MCWILICLSFARFVFDGIGAASSGIICLPVLPVGFNANCTKSGWIEMEDGLMECPCNVDDAIVHYITNLFAIL